MNEIQVHKAAWERLIERALSDPYARYALYASRIIAVRHPEAYLIGDNWFYEGACRIKGFREAYEEPTALGWCHMKYGHEFFQKGEDYAGIPGGHPLSFRALRLDKYRLATPRRIYPEPYFPLLDDRFAPLPVTLKTEGKVVTPLEMAEIAYFQAKEEGVDPDRLFLVHCENDESYLVRNEEIISVRTGRAVSSVNDPPVLIFNEYVVWHPTMGRDDRDKSPSLREVVDQLTRGRNVPRVGDDWEHKQVIALRDASALEDEDQLRMAALASVRAGGWRFHPYAGAWRGFVPDEDLDIDISRRLGLIREFDWLANSVSPAAAYLCGVMGEGTVEERMRRFSREYLLNTGMVREAEAHGWKKAWRLESWGHLWPCGLMEHTIDDAFRSRTGHCVSQAHMVGAVLELAGIPHVVVNFDRGGVKEGVNHHFVLSRDGSFLVDDGIVNFLGIDPPTEDYGPLLSFTIYGEWASTVGDRLYGNVSADRVADKVEEIDAALNGRFELHFFADETAKEVVGKEEFLALLKGREVEQVPLP